MTQDLPRETFPKYAPLVILVGAAMVVSWGLKTACWFLRRVPGSYRDWGN